MIDQAEKLRELVRRSSGNKDSNVERYTDKVQREVEAKDTEGVKVITIASGKGGVGKTNVVVNLAIQLQKLGNRVIIIDADFGFANIDVILGIVPKYNFIDLINNRLAVTEILTEGPYGIKFISGASEIKQLANFTDQQINNFIEGFSKLADMADYILIDTGAGVTDSALQFMNASDEIMIVTTPEPTAMTDAYILIKTIKTEEGLELDDCKFRIVINLVNSNKEGQDIYNKISKVANKFLDLNLDCMGYIPFDLQLMNSVRKQTPVSISFPKSKAVAAFEEIAAKLGNENIKEVKLQCEEVKTKGIYSFITKLVGRKVKR